MRKTDEWMWMVVGARLTNWGREGSFSARSSVRCGVLQVFVLPALFDPHPVPVEQLKLRGGNVLSRLPLDRFHRSVVQADPIEDGVESDGRTDGRCRLK